MVTTETTVKTNYVPRPLVSADQLPVEVLRDDFWYVLEDENDVTQGASDYSARFFEYRGSWYDTHEFERIARYTDNTGPFFAGLRVADDSPILRWDAVQTESAFSAVVIRLGAGGESVVVGYAHW